jgi:uncharacterized repeat protein (TIGR02543 family)
MWADEGGAEVTKDTVITTDTAIHAEWKANEYTLTYGLNGGDSVFPGNLTVTYDSPIGPLATPERKGYTFVGWRETPGGNSIVAAGAVWRSLEDRSIYASWSPNIYTIYFDGQGGRFEPLSKTVTYDDIYGELPAPVRTGKVFDGWYTLPIGGQHISPTGDVKVDADQTLYAHYSEVDRTAIRPVGQNEWKTFEGSRYRFDKKGVMLTGLQKVGKHYYYFDSAGRLVTKGKVRLSGYILKPDKTGRIKNMPRPNRTTVTKAKATAKRGKKIAIRWKKLIGVSGYQVQYALDKDFTKETGVKTVKGRTTLKKVINRLARSKRYYVRVRGYFIIDGLKVPGVYSKAVRSRL